MNREGVSNETSPPTLSAFGRGCSRAAGGVADRAGASLSNAAGARELEFTPNNESFDQLAKNLGFQCFLYKLTSTGTPGIQSGWNFSLCTIFHDRVTEYCIDKTCQVVTTNTSETKDSCPPP